MFSIDMRKGYFLPRAVISLTLLLIAHVTYVIVVILMTNHYTPFKQTLIEIDRRHGFGFSTVAYVSYIFGFGNETDIEIGAPNVDNETTRFSIRRNTPDLRPAVCSKFRSGRNNHRTPLPNASIIIAFGNEPRSSLLRTIHSIVDRSPPELIKEILVVDRSSSNSRLWKSFFEHYILSISNKIRIIRKHQPLSYAAAVNLALAQATSNIVVTISALTECTEGWMQPLLARVVESPYSIAVPVVHYIDGETFEYEEVHSHDAEIGSFSWDLNLKKRKFSDFYHHVPPMHTERIPTDLHLDLVPMIADGIFAADRQYLQYLGGMTESLSHISPALVELSFRCWLCGRKIELVPCSRVGILNIVSEISETVNLEDRTKIVHWWLGEFKFRAHERLNTPQEEIRRLRRLTDAKASHQHPLRHLHCQDIKWFLENVEPTKVISDLIIGAGYLEQRSDIVLSVVEDQHVVAVKRQKGATRFKKLHEPKIVHEFWYLLDTGQLQNEDGMCLYFDGSDSENQPLHYEYDVQRNNDRLEEDNKQLYPGAGVKPQDKDSLMLTANNMVDDFPKLFYSDLHAPDTYGDEILSDVGDHEVEHGLTSTETDTPETVINQTVPTKGKRNIARNVTGLKLEQLLMTSSSNITPGVEEEDVAINETDNKISDPLERRNRTVSQFLHYNTKKQKLLQDVVKSSTQFVLKKCASWTAVTWTLLKTGLLHHIPTQKCLEVDIEDTKGTNTELILPLRLSECDSKRDNQRWNFSHVDPLAPPITVYGEIGLTIKDEL